MPTDYSPLVTSIGNTLVLFSSLDGALREVGLSDTGTMRL